MRFLPVLSLFLAGPALPASLPALAAPAAACLPLHLVQAEPDGWLLLAALVVCTAGRLATQPR
jgi:hypothetical protein